MVKTVKAAKNNGRPVVTMISEGQKIVIYCNNKINDNELSELIKKRASRQ